MNTIERLAEENRRLREAIVAGGWDIAPCKMCGRPVVCLPDGLPLCRPCADFESGVQKIERQEERRVNGKLSYTDYIDGKGRVLFVHDGISRGAWFGTFFKKPSGSLKRIVSKWLPMRSSRSDAQADLDVYAKSRGLLEKGKSNG